MEIQRFCAMENGTRDNDGDLSVLYGNFVSSKCGNHDRHVVLKDNDSALFGIELGFLEALTDAFFVKGDLFEGGNSSRELNNCQLGGFQRYRPSPWV
mmetsp:Transcript_8665/g.17589  ORF Transcript_8665/g.17589 Transcript_8665/m.17589 type:complete len:97 (+) Transcript_8665:133-423(+)